MSPLTLLLLGPPCLERDSVRVELHSRQALALFAFLVVTGERQTRDTLATLLRPNAAQASARAALRNAIWVLKKAIGEHYLELDRESVGLSPTADVRTDVERFHDLVTACRRHGHPEDATCPACLAPLSQAVSLYRGEFMAGFSLRDSPAFDDWQLFQQESLRCQLISALQRLVQGHCTQGCFQPAIAYGRRWLALDPLNEAAHRQFMQMLTWSGQRNAALQQYQECFRLLQAELNQPPQPETTQLYQAIRKGSLPPPSPPALSRPPPTCRHNLPFQPTSFVGREAELARIGHLLQDPACRLLTLAGPGGIGKTRLALQAAAQRLDTFGHGVFFIPLSTLRSPDLLPAAIASTLQFAFYGGENPQLQLLNYLREKQMLLILDNFEHLLEGTDLLVDILQTAPAVKLLVTSRERLNVSWEWLVDVPGLEYPQDGTSEDIEECSAVQLFLHRARRVRPEFSIGQAEKTFVGRLCQLVGGVPLAIELAASWVREYSCAEIVQEVERNLDFLQTRMRDVPARHRSLRAVFDHSWDLLTVEEQAAFRRLSVFHGGFTRKAGGEVAGATPTLLAALGEKSLLRRQPSGRYQMLEVIRQYAAGRLAEAPREEASTRRRHCACYTALLQRRNADLRGNKQKEALKEISEEMENARAAWNWALVQGWADGLSRALGGLFLFYDVHGWFHEGMALLGRTLEECGKPGDTAQEGGWQALRARLLVRQGAFLCRVGRPAQAMVLLQEGVAVLRCLDDAAELAFALGHLGSAARLLGEHDLARKSLQESLAICTRFGDRRGMADALTSLGLVSYARGQHARARKLFQGSLALARQVGDRRGMARCLNNLGGLVDTLGNYAAARGFYEESLALCQELGDRRGLAFALTNLGAVLSRLGEHDEAKRCLQDGLAVFTEIGERTGMAIAFNGLSLAALQLGEYREALEFCRESLSISRETGDVWRVACSLQGLGELSCMVGAYDEARTYLLEGLQVAMQIKSVSFALGALVGLATVLAHEGARERALELLVLCTQHLGCNQAARDKVDRLIAELEPQLSLQDRAEAWERGKNRSLEEVAAEVLSGGVRPA